ncbi:hypothetical protein [Streptomyces sp. DH37]|uniref:hypothetical protein n=1 Tax=Streptomyces sp. DH37 TaxID=3040122 RepID=UPI0024420DB7|nr:hypothetical protein [Streptomyces sp. DH37]MDG9703796.1 hypothetical protein [Streptomyces sp. DH37]
MTTLIIAIRDADQETKRRAVDALHDAGLTIAEAQLTSGPVVLEKHGQDDTGEHPAGPLKWVAALLFLAVPALLVGWIWAGEWRYGATAGVALLAAFMVLGLSLAGRDQAA